MSVSVDSVMRRIREAIINHAVIKEIQLGQIEAEIFKLELVERRIENPWLFDGQAYDDYISGIGGWNYMGAPVVEVDKESWLALVLK